MIFLDRVLSPRVNPASMKAFQRLLMAVPAAAFLGTAVAPISGLANELNLQQVQDYSVAQDTSIRDFSDVYPTDWAYQTLAELVDTYGCIAGYPDGTFRGNNPITRYEMAAILNACFDSLATSISMMEGDDGSSMEAMEAMENLQRLNESLSAELITLKGAVDGLDAKVAELENSGQFFTTTKTSFEIATDFVYTPKIEAPVSHGGLAMASSVDVVFETSFTGTDSLSFKLEGDVIGSEHTYLAGEFYDVAGGRTNVNFTGFSYETKVGNHMSLGLGTDYDELAGIVGADTYYPGGGTPDLEDAGMTAYGDLGISVAFDLISGDAGTLTASAGYAVDSGDAASPEEHAGLFGDKTDRAGALALNWEGPLFGGNDARFTVVYQNVKMAANTKGADEDFMENWNLILGSYLTETLSLSGNYQFGQRYNDDTAQWMVAANLEDAFIPGNSFGIAYGTSGVGIYPTNQFLTSANEFPKVLEVYYNFAINDNLEVPIYLDFLSHPGEDSEFAFAVRPTLTF